MRDSVIENSHSKDDAGAAFSYFMKIVYDRDLEPYQGKACSYVPLVTEPLKIISSKWAFTRSLARLLARSLARSSARLRLRLRLRLLSSSLALASLLPRYLVQLFRRLKGPEYADTLFVTRESRRGCLRQAGRRDSAGAAFPPSARKLRTSRRAYRTLIFRHRLAAIFPFLVGFRRLFYLPAWPPAATRERGS